MSDYDDIKQAIEEFEKTLIFCKANLFNLKLDIAAASADIEVEITDHCVPPFYYYSKKCLIFELIKEEHEEYLKTLEKE